MKGNLSSILALLARSVMLFVKSVMAAIGAPMTEAAVNRAINRILSLGKLRSLSGFCSSVSTSFKSAITPA